MEAFFIPAGVAVEVYATTLHYAPCSTAKNKWLIAHEEAEIESAFCGLVGENIDISEQLSAR